MAWKKSATFTGSSGQMAVIGELLHRKCNAAIPHVDIGTDVFAFQDDSENFARIQVKTAAGNRYKAGGGYSAKFGIPLVQLERIDTPPLFYALAVRLERGWGRFIVISRTKLKTLWKDHACGSANTQAGTLELHIQLRPSDGSSSETGYEAFCGNVDLTSYLDAWESLPPLKPIEPFPT